MQKGKVANGQFAACPARVFVILLAVVSSVLFFICERGFAEQGFLHARK